MPNIFQRLGISKRERDLEQVASVAVFRADGKMLFGQRKDDDLRYALPGGHLNPGEPPERAALRELIEETGLIPKSLHPLGSETVEGRRGPVLVHCYTANVVAAEPDASKDPDQEFGRFVWVDPDDVPDDILEHLRSKHNAVLQFLGIQDRNEPELHELHIDPADVSTEFSHRGA